MVTKASRHDPIVLLVFGTSLLMGSGSVVFTLLPAMQDKVGFATWGFGLIAGVFFATSLVAQLGLARWADRGRARPLLVAAIALGVGALLWLSVADSLWELTVARGLGGLGAGCWGPAARAIAIAGRPDRPARRLAYIAMGDTSGMVIGPLAGAVLATTFSLEAAFLAFAALIGLLSPIVAITPITEVTRGSTRPARLSDLIARRPVQQATLMAVALFLPVGLYETVWGKHISNLGGSTHIIALSVALYGLPYMLVAPIGGRLGDRFGPGPVAFAGAGALVVVTIVTGLPRSLWLLLPIGVVEAVVSAVAYPNSLAAMAKACSGDEQATGQGLAGGASIAGAGVMAILAGPMFGFGGPVVAFTGTALIVAAIAGLALWLDPSIVRRPATAGRSGATDPAEQLAAEL